MAKREVARARIDAELKHNAEDAPLKKDVALARRRGKDLGKLRRILERLIAEEPLSDLHRDHPLIGDDVGRSECHVEQDWLLLYKLEGEDIIFERTGPHADLFRWNASCDPGHLPRFVRH